MIDFFKSGENRIAYEHINGQGIGIMFLSGHRSEMNKGSKTVPIKKLCIDNNVPFTAFDYSGYGASSGETGLWLTDTWLKNTVDIIDHVLTEPTILVGNSMGGYLMLMAALQRPDKVHSLSGIAAGFGSYYQKTKRHEIHHEGTSIKIGFSKTPIEHHYIDQKLEIDKPIRLIHGLNDEVVPAQSAQNIAQQVTSDNVEIHYTKRGNHKLKQPEIIPIIWRHILNLREDNF